MAAEVLRPAKKKHRVEGTPSQDEMMGRPLETPGDDLKDVSLQPSQSLRHILSAGSSVDAAVHTTVQSAGTEQNKKASAAGQMGPAPGMIEANSPSKYQTVIPMLAPKDLTLASPSAAIKNFALLQKQLLQAATLTRSYEVELEGFKTSGLFTELEGKVKELTELVARLEKNNVNLMTRGDRFQDSWKASKERVTELAKRVSGLETQRQKNERALAAAEVRVTEKDKALAAAEARASEAAAALADLKAMYAADKEASERLAQEKAKEFEDFKATMVVICNDKFDEGFQTCDAETKEVVEMVDPNFNWDKFEDILAAKEKEKEKAGPSGHAQTK